MQAAGFDGLTVFGLPHIGEGGEDDVQNAIVKGAVKSCDLDDWMED